MSRIQPVDIKLNEQNHRKRNECNGQKLNQSKEHTLYRKSERNRTNECIEIWKRSFNKLSTPNGVVTQINTTHMYNVQYYNKR